MIKYGLFKEVSSCSTNVYLGSMFNIRMKDKLRGLEGGEIRVNFELIKKRLNLKESSGEIFDKHCLKSRIYK